VEADLRAQENESPRIRQLSASALIAEAIRRVYNNESLSNLFHEDDRGP
jgi:phosphoribosylpyrophosphate synthetase